MGMMANTDRLRLSRPEVANPTVIEPGDWPTVEATVNSLRTLKNRIFMNSSFGFD